MDATLFCMQWCRSLVLQAAEQVTLKNGYNLLCDHREQEGDRVRLFTSRDSGNFVEVDAAAAEHSH